MADVHGELADTMRTELTSHFPDEDEFCQTCKKVGRYSKYPCPPRVAAERAHDELMARMDRWFLDPPE